MATASSIVLYCVSGHVDINWRASLSNRRDGIEWFLPSFIPSHFPSQALRLRALQPLSTSPRLTSLKHGPFLPCSVNSPLHTEIAC
jgi:hypothetical protein